MKNKEAIEYMENEISCIKTASEGLCNRECSKCDLVKEEAPLIKAYDMAIEALEKQIPKKPAYEGDSYAPDGSFVYDEWLCPNCGSRYEVDYDEYDYCPNCGQKIDWSEDEVEE